MIIEPDQLLTLHSGKDNLETGMNFQFIIEAQRILAVLEDGSALPFYDDSSHYDIGDLVAGTSIPTARSVVTLPTTPTSFPTRLAALTALRAAAISPLYTGSAGAIPLVFSTTLADDTIFYRCLSSPNDPRYISGSLAAGTYLTTALDRDYANSGFATVGRYALPIPLPASYVLQYELPKNTKIKVGTVAPMFGQAGGGVEVQLLKATLVPNVGSFVVTHY
jgi:hypothetical protein